MKRLTSLFLSLMMLLGLTACGADDASLGVIGGADGPTAIITAGPDDLFFSPADEEEIGVIGSADGTTTIITEESTTFFPTEGGYYYDLENVVLYLYYYGELPDNYITKRKARALGWEGGSVEEYLEGAAIGGDTFGNREGLLPDGDYTECDLNTLGADARGAERLVFSDDGRYYHTEDHYANFTEVWVEDGEVIW